MAFAAALQHLSARQRGALILRDALSFSASETAEILGTTVVSVNSSLQRARTRVKEVGVRQERVSEPSTAEQRAWVERYMKAFELADVEGLKRLLTEDVIMEMPPMVNWFSGRGNYGLFMEWVFGAAGKDWLLGDADGMVADYAADATAIMPGSLRDSRDVIRENMALAFEGPLKGSSTYNNSASASSAGTPRSSSANPASCSPARPRFRTPAR